MNNLHAVNITFDNKKVFDVHKESKHEGLNIHKPGELFIKWMDGFIGPECVVERDFYRGIDASNKDVTTWYFDPTVRTVASSYRHNDKTVRTVESVSGIHSINYKILWIRDEKYLPYIYLRWSR